MATSKYYQQHKKEVLLRTAARYVEKKEEIRVYKQKYYQLNKPRLNQESGDYQKQRRRQDPQFRLRQNFSGAINRALRNGKKNRCFQLLGYTQQELKEHLEKLFTVGMTWGNYGRGGWVVDHIKPQCSFKFDSTVHPEFRACWALTNLRPLWEKDNLVKIAEDIKLRVK